MRYLSICALWIACFFLPRFAGEWYDSHLSVYNAAVSCFLLFAVLRISREWWALFLADLSVMQVLFNTADVLFNIPAQHYNHILQVLNTIEVFILFGCGGGAQIYRMIRNGIGNRHRDSNFRCISPASGLPRGKDGI